MADVLARQLRGCFELWLRAGTRECVHGIVLANMHPPVLAVSSAFGDILPKLIHMARGQAAESYPISDTRNQ